MPSITKSRPWTEIEGVYLELNEHGWKHDRLLELVRHIQASGVSERLFAFTSVDRLTISIYQNIEWERETLVIGFDRVSEKWNFSYFDVPFKKPEFVRQYDAELGKQKFDDFVKMLQW